MFSDLWVEEKISECYGMRFKVEKVLFSKKSPFQTVDIVETKGHGRMLLNDGLVMLSERDEFIYHEMITHVPLFLHPNPKKVLVIGGGDGGTAREVIRHKSVQKCVMVEIDQVVVNACREFIPQTASCLDDPKIILIIEDGVKYVHETKEKFDVIIVDSTDPIGPAQPLFGIEFYRDIFSCLTEDGIVVSQGESPIYHVEMQNKLMSIINQVFPISSIYHFTNLTYPGGRWCFTYAAKTIKPNQIDFTKVLNQKIECQYYNAEVHQAAFVLPEFMKKNLSPWIKV